MPIILKSDISFKEPPKPVVRGGGEATSLESLRARLEPKVEKPNEIRREFKPKVRDTNTTLIQYKESSFLNDMLSNDKE